MPTALTEITGKVQDQVLDVLRASQDAVVDTVTSVADTVQRVLPEPARAPLAANLPLASESVDQAFGFAGKVLEAQHNFVNRVLSAVTPKEVPAKPAKTTSSAKPAASTAA
jgi:ABC-type transporter Mla subunit MlaD